jgi:WD40 repeat protein
MSHEASMHPETAPQRAGKTATATAATGQAKKAMAATAGTSMGATGRQARTNPKDSAWPADERVNPYLSQAVAQPGNVKGWVQYKTFEGHQLSIASIAMHPKRPILATVSDDNTWKIWNLPSTDQAILIMSGEGHRDWISSVAFHPKGTHIATSSGDA